MISYIEGKVLAVAQDSITVLTAAGIGFQVFVPNSVFSTVSRTGTDICLYTYMQVREDGMALFGFLTDEELTMFKKVISVSGVGPKLGIALLSTLDVTELCYAIMAGDSKTITRAPGVGKKMAEKIILDLKDYVADRNDPETDLVSYSQGDTNDSKQLVNEAVMALTSLGISGTDAMKALKNISITDDTTVEDLIKQALKKI